MTNDTQSELLPCPFCGGTELFRTADNINMTDRINCKSCNANAVLWKWNTRTITPPVSAVMGEALRDIISCKEINKILREDFPMFFENAKAALSTSPKGDSNVS